MKQASIPDLPYGSLLGAAALGAALMYLLDPERGAVRRDRSGQRLRQLGRQTGEALDKVMHGTAPGVVDAMSSGAGTMRGGEPGHAPPEPYQAGDRGAQRASARHDGGMHGRLHNGESWRHGLAHTETGRGMRGAALASGGALGMVGLFAQRSPLTLAIGLAGLALLARSAAPGSISRLLGSGRSRAITVERTVRIDAPPELVYDQFANYENFPRYMSNVVEVRDLGQRRSHWVVKGPAGTEYTWDAVLTEHDRPHRLAWETEPGSDIEQSGDIYLEPFRNGTRATVRLSYRPPAGALGHAVAALTGTDPKRQLDQDLSRMKTLIERGSMPPGGVGGGAARERERERVLH